VEKSDLTESELDSGVADLLDAMAAFNGEFNGAVPSEARTASQSVPRDATYAVGEVIRLLHDAERSNLNTLRYGDRAWLAETAWLAVRAGDVDDLRQHLLHDGRCARHDRDATSPPQRGLIAGDWNRRRHQSEAIVGLVLPVGAGCVSDTAHCRSPTA
jgi:hypothetical protein